jgi:hypothetical protein
MEILTNLSLGLNVKGLLATFSQVSSNSINGFGQIYTDHAPYVLGIFTASGPMPGTISAYSVPFTGSMFRYAVVDFSGFTTNLNLAYHF